MRAETCPSRSRIFPTLQPETVFDFERGGRDDRAAPVFFAAVNDSVAFGEAGEGSYFNRALLVALERGADSSREVNGKTVWPVSVSSLTCAITNEFMKFETEQNFAPTGIPRDVDICYLNQAPMVDVIIEVLPDAQRQNAVITMTQWLIHHPSHSCGSNPIRRRTTLCTHIAGRHSPIAAASRESRVRPERQGSPICQPTQLSLYG